MDEKVKGIAILKGYIYAKRMLDRHKVQRVTDEYGKEMYSNFQQVEGGTKLYFVEHEPESRRVKRGYGRKRTYHNTPVGTVKRYCVDPDSIHRKYLVNGDMPKGFSDPCGDIDLFDEKELMCLSLVRKVDSIMGEWEDDERELIKRKYLVDGAPIADRIVRKSLRSDGYKMSMEVYRNKLVGCLVALADHLNGFQGGENIDQSNQALFV